MTWLSARDVAARLSVARSTVYVLITKHGFPKPLKFGGKSLWREDEVQAWIDLRSEARVHG